MFRAIARYVIFDDGRPVQCPRRSRRRTPPPSTATSYYYRDELWIWLPTKASGLRATAGSTTLRVREATDAGYQYAVVTLPRRLLYGQTSTVKLSYLIAGSPPRSKDPARVGDGYAALPVASEGDAGGARIEIVSPSSMEITAEPKAPRRPRVRPARRRSPEAGIPV